MIANNEIKTWQQRSTNMVKFGEFLSDRTAMAEEIAELRAALEAANHRIEDLTTAANRCINDALGMASVGQQGNNEFPLPELDTLHDIQGALDTPEDWDEDYRNTWQKLQVAERNKMQWRAYAIQLSAAIAQHAGSRDGMFDRKLGDLKLRGYEVIGRILHKEGQYALFDSSCRWLSKEQYRRLMHEQDGSLFATGSQPDSERDAARLDFVLDNSTFICTIDDGMFQLMTQDEDEDYHVVSGDGEAFKTKRAAVDAAMAAQQGKSAVKS